MTITSHRNQRPWSSGDAPDTIQKTRVEYSEDCYLCPGNTRVSGKQNDRYASIYVFDNDHPAFSHAAPEPISHGPGIYKSAKANGTTRVMCYSPNHELSLAELDEESFYLVFQTWAEQTESLLQREDVTQVLIFENKGEVIGVSNPHPHCQIYAADFEFKNLQLEREAMEQHALSTNRQLMTDVLESELEANTRIVSRTNRTMSFLPYFSRFPFEAFVCPKNSYNYLYEMANEDLKDFARVTRDILIRFDNLWRKPFPYMLVLHQAPKGYSGEYHSHIQIHPLMRQPTLQKYLAGVESGGGHFLNDVDPDGAAKQLRSLSSEHYLS